ncbi:MAG: amidase [Acidimicrobiaceae bacterium]|nr:amidase [Acidimicrobiaceae bacterium]MYE64329.1 amidase [Acidimicrobiaceae bacterium]
MTELTQMSLAEAAEAVRTGKVTATGLVEACLARIEHTDGSVGAFASVQADEALAEAARLDGGEASGPLHGVPVALKDLIFTRGTPTEANCAALRGFTPERDATVVSRLRGAGAVIIGKTNTHELAYGVSCPASRNPWNPQRMTGGSSGGSAASLAARQVFGALGTDTGGSVRIPSSYCGTTGIKTTRGAVPRDGVHLISWTYDTVGPMARTAADCGALLDVLAGFSRQDPYSSKTPLGAAGAPTGLVLGVPDEGFFEGFETDPEVRAAMDEAVDVLGSVVAEVRTVRVPNTAEHFDAGAAIVFAESAALLEELRSSSNELIGDEPRAIMDSGAEIPGTALAAAQARRVSFERACLDVFEDQGVDLIVAPVTPNQVLDHGAVELGGIPLIPATTQFTFPVNAAGLPAIALPGGFAADGIPIGFQIIARPFADRTLVAVGEAFQKRTDHHAQTPGL